MTVETGGRGVLTRKGYRVHGELSLFPALDRCVTVAATECGSDVVRSDVATAAVSGLNVEIPLLVTRQARRHRAYRVAHGSVEAVAYCTVTLTTGNGRGRLQHSLVRYVQQFARSRTTEISVAQQTGCFEVGAGICDQPVVSATHVIRARCPAVTSHAAQPPVNGFDGRGLDHKTLALIFRSSERLDLPRISVAVHAFARERSRVVEAR
jgi:hypothetical protein